jgi:hypothetical protein
VSSLFFLASLLLVLCCFFVASLLLLRCFFVVSSLRATRYGGPLAMTGRWRRSMWHSAAAGANGVTRSGDLRISHLNNRGYDCAKRAWIKRSSPMSIAFSS